MKVFQVPQREVQVEVLLSGGERLNGTLYAPQAGPSGGPGRLSDRLNDGEERFLPLVADEGAHLVSKSRVMAIHLPPGEEDLEFEEGDQAKECSVELYLEGGVVLTGSLKYIMPVERLRIIDYLNAAPEFIPLLDNGRVVLVSRRFLVRIRDLEGAG
jgi:hypothetical protein